MSHLLDEVLAKLGWETGFQVPVANAENKTLEEAVARLTLQKFKAKSACEASTTKLENLSGHLKYIKQEHEENQKLITTYAQQLQSEEDKYRLIVREKDKVDQEIRKFVKQTSEVEERQNSKRQQLEKSVTKIEKLKSETNWDNEALKAWEESLKKRDDNNELIKKLSREDERKYNELEAKRAILELEFATREETVARMACDITNYERILQRTGEVMVQQVAERDSLVKQWKDSVRFLHQRDGDIDRIQNQIVQTHSLVEKQLEKLEEQLQFYRNEIQNNDQLSFESNQLNQTNSKKRRDLIDLTQLIHLLKSEADTLRRMLTSTANTLEKKRGERRFITSEIVKKEKKVERYRKELIKLQSKRDEITTSSATAGERAKHLNKMIEFEEKQYRILVLQSQQLQAASFKVFQELQEQLNIGKMKENLINGLTTRVSHMRKYNKDSKREVDKQREGVYEMDYRIEQIGRKICKMEHDTHFDDDKDEVTAKLNELDAKFNEFNEIKNLLQDQVTKIEEDMRRLTSTIAHDRIRLTSNQDKLQDRLLNFEGGQKQLNTSKHHLQERQVEENILKLRVNQLEDEMNKEQKTIYTLQRFRLNLEHAVHERLIEIGTARDMLLAKRRNLNEDKGRLRLDLADRHMRLEQFRKKYDIVMVTMGSDDDGNPLSITHFKIKNAQEKFMLQQEGDELDQKIQKAEREIIAMENTLRLVNVTNSQFKKNLAAVDDDSPETNEMTHLNDEHMKTTDSLRQYRRDYNRKKEEISEMTKRLQEIQEKYDFEESELKKLEDKYYKALESKAKGEQKIHRTQHCLKTVAKKIKGENLHGYNRDLEIRQLKEVNTNVTNKLTAMSVSNPEVAPLITRYTLEYDVRLPEKCRSSTSTSSFSVVSCVSGSSTSSLSSKRSVKSQSTSSKPSSSRSSGSIHKVTLTFNV